MLRMLSINSRMAVSKLNDPNDRMKAKTKNSLKSFASSRPEKPKKRKVTV